MMLAKQGIDMLKFRGAHPVFQSEDREPGVFAGGSERAEVREEIVLEVFQCGGIAVHRIRFLACDSITGTLRAGTG